MSTLDVFISIRNRLNFFSLYSLFDTVAYNQIDLQRQQQKQWIHMKNFEQDLLLLNSKLERFETLATIVDEPEKLNKLEQLLENIDLDDLFEAVKLYRDNLAFFQENTSMISNSQNIAFGRGQNTSQQMGATKSKPTNPYETDPVPQITEEDEESSAQRHNRSEEEAVRDSEQISRPVEAEEMKGDEGEVFLSEFSSRNRALSQGSKKSKASKKTD